MFTNFTLPANRKPSHPAPPPYTLEDNDDDDICEVVQGLVSATRVPSYVVTSIKNNNNVIKQLSVIMDFNSYLFILFIIYYLFIYFYIYIYLFYLLFYYLLFIIIYLFILFIYALASKARNI